MTFLPFKKSYLLILKAKWQRERGGTKRETPFVQWFVAHMPAITGVRSSLNQESEIPSGFPTLRAGIQVPGPSSTALPVPGWQIRSREHLRHPKQCLHLLHHNTGPNTAALNNKIIPENSSIPDLPFSSQNQSQYLRSNNKQLSFVVLSYKKNNKNKNKKQETKQNKQKKTCPLKSEIISF